MEIPTKDRHLLCADEQHHHPPYLWLDKMIDGPLYMAGYREVTRENASVLIARIIRVLLDKASRYLKRRQEFNVARKVQEATDIELIYKEYRLLVIEYTEKKLSSEPVFDPEELWSLRLALKPLLRFLDKQPPQKLRDARGTLLDAAFELSVLFRVWIPELR